MVSNEDKKLLELFAQGLTNKQVAQRLQLAERTVQNRSSQLYKVLGVSNRAQAIASYLSAKLFMEQLSAKRNKFPVCVRARIQSMVLGARKRAKLRGIECTIKPKDLIPFIVDICPVLGIELSWENDKPGEDSPSLDRIDITKGYTPDNITIISMRANRLKDNGTLAEHRALVEWLSIQLER